MASNSILANMSVVLGANVAEFQKNFSMAEKQLKGFARAGEAMKGFGENLSKWVSAPLAGLAAVSLKTFGDIEALKKGLQAVAGSAEAADKQFNDLKEVAKLPGLGLEEAIKGSVRLQTVGFSAEKAKESLMVLGNAVATVGGGAAELERAAYGLQQLTNTEFPLGEDLNILKDAIPQITPLLKEAFGTARTEELQKMGVTSQQVVDTIVGGLGKLPRVTGGVKNAFESLGDSIKVSTATFGEAINKTLNFEGFLNSLAGKLEALAEGFSRLNPNIQRFIVIGGAIAAALGPVLVIFGGILTAIPSMVAGYTALTMGMGKMIAATKAWAIANGILVIKIAAITAAVAALALIAKSIYDSWGTIAAFFGRMWAQIQLTFANGLLSIIKSVNAVGSKVGIEFKSAENSLQRFADSAKSNLDSKPYVSFTDAVGTVGQAMTDNLTDGMAKIKSLFFSGAAAAETGAEDIAGSVDKIKDKAKGLSEEQQKALDKLVTGWNDATNKGLVYGDSYDQIGEKAKLLTSTIDALIESGLKPQSRIIQQLKRDLDAFNSAAIQAIGPREGAGKMEIPVKLKFLPIDPAALQAVFDPAAIALENFVVSANSIIQSALVNGFVALGEGLANAINGGGIADSLNGFLMVILDFAGQFGQAMIALGIAKTNFDTLLASIGGGPAAIAAGVALVALAGVAKGVLKKGPSYGGATPTAPRSASPNYGNPGMGSGYGSGKVEFVISGNSLQGVLTREEYRKQRFW